MRKSILIIATVALSILNVNATNNTPKPNATEITKNNIAQVFEWQVETTKRTYAGTSLSLKQAKKMIQLSSSGEVVTGTKISSYFVLKSETDPAKRNYFWEVKTVSGSAKGYSSSEAYAHKMMRLVASGDVIVEKIIISQPQQ